MAKSVLAFLFFALSGAVYSQSNTLEEMSQDVNQLISAHSDKLSEDDKLSIKKNLRQIQQIFKMNGLGLPTGGSYICDASNNQLINLDLKVLIHDFNSYDHCTEALANVKVGKGFCDYSDNKLRSSAGKLVFDFSDGINCKEAIESIYKVKKFCDFTDNTLRNSDGVLLYDFNSKEECMKGLN